MVSYAKLILMAVGGKCRSVIFVLKFHVGLGAHIRNVIKRLNINARITCDCLTWIVLYKDLY